MRLLFLFTFHQLVDAWRKFADSALKLIMLRNNRNSRLQENLFIWKQNPMRKLGSSESRFLWKNVSYSPRVPPGRPSRTTGWEFLI